MPPTVSDRRPHVVPPRGGPPGAGVGPSPSTTPHDGSMQSEDMPKALKLLQSVMSEEDVSKYEKMMMPPPPKKEERVKLREQELFEKAQEGTKSGKARTDASGTGQEA